MTDVVVGGGHVICILMTHCVRKSICDSPLTVCVSFFECAFNSSFVTFEFVTVFVTRYCGYIQNIFEDDLF